MCKYHVKETHDLSCAPLPEQHLIHTTSLYTYNISVAKLLCCVAVSKPFRNTQSSFALASDISHIPAPRSITQGLCKLIKLLNCLSTVKVLKSSSNKLPVTRVRDAERQRERASGGLWSMRTRVVKFKVKAHTCTAVSFCIIWVS